MKKVYPVIFFLLTSAYICVAQVTGQRLENLKIGFISRELKLNSTEAQLFWPVYNGYIFELKKARVTYPNDEIAFGEARLTIQKRYRPEFKRILGSDGRVNQTYLMEPQFREMLRRTLIDRQHRTQSLVPLTPQYNRVWP